MMKLKANFFSGKVSRKETAIVNIYKDLIEVAVSGSLLTFKTTECEVGDIFLNRPAIVTLPDNSRLEIFFNVDQYEELKELISKRSHVFQKKNIFLLSLITVCFVFTIFKFVIPALSSSIAKVLPNSMAKRIDQMVIEKLNNDKDLNSKLSDKKQKEIRDFLLSKTDIKINLYFKNMEDIGANAFALADNSIVITDKLVEILKSKDLILPIFLHETGHLKHKHVLTQMVSVFTFQVFLLLTTGQSDLMSSVTNISSSLAILKYSRNLELEADEYALNTLHNLNYSPHCFAKSFELLSKEAEKKEVLKIEYFSTHPNSEERIQNAYDLKNGDKYLKNCSDTN